MTAGQAATAVLEVLPFAGWIDAFPEGAVYGSLYAATESDRDETADRLAAAGIPLHLDVIIDDEDGAAVHRGIAPAQVRAIGVRHPDSLLEVHVIVLPEAFSTLPPEARAATIGIEIDAVLESAAAAGVQRVVLPASRAFDDAVTADFRRAGGEVWAAVDPEDDPAVAAERAAAGHGGTSGALVMLIEPGTRQAARADLLLRAARLAGITRVAVDGGLDHSLAARAIAHGAHHVVVGRALLGIHTTEPHRGEPA